jgi:hypothetical protein
MKPRPDCNKEAISIARKEDLLYCPNGDIMVVMVLIMKMMQRSRDSPDKRRGKWKMQGENPIFPISIT